MLSSLPPHLAALLAALTLGLMGGACVDEGAEPVVRCDGAKCDDPGGEPTAYAAAVLGCDEKLEQALAEAGNSASLAIEAHADFSVCLQAPENASMATIEEGLIESGAPLRSAEEIAIAFDEFRYASLCVDIEAASTLVGEELELLEASCQASRERSLAEVIGGVLLFDNEGRAWDLGEQREGFPDCYAAYDETLLVASTPSDVAVAGELLALCAETSLRAQALPLMEARCEQGVCFDAILALAFVQAGIETAIVTSNRMCQLLVDSSAYQTREAPELGIDCRMTSLSGLASQVAAALR